MAIIALILSLGMVFSGAKNCFLIAIFAAGFLFLKIHLCYNDMKIITYFFGLGASILFIVATPPQLKRHTMNLLNDMTTKEYGVLKTEGFDD